MVFDKSNIPASILFSVSLSIPDENSSNIRISLPCKSYLNSFILLVSPPDT